MRNATYTLVGLEEVELYLLDLFLSIQRVIIFTTAVSDRSINVTIFSDSEPQNCNRALCK